MMPFPILNLVWPMREDKRLKVASFAMMMQFVILRKLLVNKPLLTSLSACRNEFLKQYMFDLYDFSRKVVLQQASIKGIDKQDTRY